MESWIFFHIPLEQWVERWISNYKAIFDAWEDGGGARPGGGPSEVPAGRRLFRPRLRARPGGVGEVRPGAAAARTAGAGQGGEAAGNPRRGRRARLGADDLRRPWRRQKAARGGGPVQRGPAGGSDPGRAQRLSAGPRRHPRRSGGAALRARLAPRRRAVRDPPARAASCSDAWGTTSTAWKGASRACASVSGA